MGRNIGGSSGGGGGFSGGGGSFSGGPRGRSGGGGSFGSSGSSGRFGGSQGGLGSFGMGTPSARSAGGSRVNGPNVSPPGGGFGGMPVGPPPGGFGRGPIGPLAGGFRGPIIVPPVVVGGGGARPAPAAQRGARGSTGCATAAITLVIVAVVLVVAVALFTGWFPAEQPQREAVASTVERTKIKDAPPYQNEVYDELGWINTGTVANGIRQFYSDTGMQPAIYLLDSQDLVGNGAAQDAEAERLFNELDLGSNGFLFVYFGEDGRADGDWTTWMGTEAATLMDAEAMQIFGSYLEQNWFSDKSEDDVFIDTFNSTGKRIMTKTTTTNDIALWVWIVLAVVAAGVVIILVMKTKRKNEAEKAAETERILNTKINDLEEDPLVEKYSDKK